MESRLHALRYRLAKLIPEIILTRAHAYNSKKGLTGWLRKVKKSSIFIGFIELHCTLAWLATASGQPGAGKY
jgi:hypothetical protein